MHDIAGFWAAAAGRSGRVDFVALGEALGGVDRLPHLPAAALVRGGLAIDHAAALASGQATQVDDPYLTLADASYPERLRATPFAPPVLHLLGDAGLLDQPAAAIVGARRCTGNGARMARQLARTCAHAGIVVVSGLAYGIDSAAHLAAEGRTIAVLGQGLRHRMTATQARTASAVLDAGGLLVSELPSLHPPSRHTFPQRNRVIAGLAVATVVVEAAHRSGALITARRALELGREVLAVPGSPLNDLSAGCLDLIDQGARMVRNGNELCEVVGCRPDRADDHGASHALLAHLADAPTFDRLMTRSGLAPGDLAQVLAGLELTGLVERLPGDRYAARGSP